MNEQQAKDLNRITILRRYEGGCAVGTLKGPINNVNTGVWLDFKDISRLYGNSEGAALSACVMAWLSNPAHMFKLQSMREAREPPQENKDGN